MALGTNCSETIYKAGENKSMNPLLETHTLWFKTQKFAFVYIPKVACTSWKLFFLKILYKDSAKVITYMNIHNRRETQLPYLVDMSIEDKQLFKTMLNHKEIKVIAIIRDPARRVLSAYLDKIYKHNNQNSLFSKKIIPEIQNFHQLPKNRRPSFLEFLGWINSKSSIHCDNNHWLPMTNIFGSLIEDQASFTLYPMNKMQDAIDEVLKIFSSSIEFPAVDALGPRKINSTDSIEATKYYGAMETKLFKTIYVKDIELYDKIYNK